MRRSIPVLVVLTVVFGTIPMTALADLGSCGDAFTPIYEIQGDGEESPLLETSDVVTEGVVTVDVQRRAEHSGFFLQDLEGDGDPSTSDGIFVFHRDTFGFDVSVGDHIRLQADVDERFSETQLGFVDHLLVCGSAPAIPLNIETREFNQNPEQYEGMYLRFPGNLFVTDTFNLHNFGEVWLADDGVVEQPTNEHPADSDEMHEMALDGIAQSIMIVSREDPGPVPFLHDNGTLRVGDMTNSLSGGVRFAFGNYKVVPDGDVDFKEKNRRTDAPRLRGDLTVVSFNVLNYWTTLGGRGAFNQDQLDAQTDKLVAAIREMDGDIVGLQEIENDPDHEPITTLVAALNTAEGADVWSWVGVADHYNIYPIRNEIIYRNDRATQVGTPVALEDPAFDDFRGLAMEPDDQLGRPPLAQTFQVDDEVFTVVVNHFKSKSPTGATGDDTDQGDGQSEYNARRVLQAQALLDFVDDLVLSTGDPDVLVIGDLNAYLEEDPVVELETELINLLDRYVKDPYSFNFFAPFAAPFIGRGTLDHAFATPSMNEQVRDTDIWHINADEPRFLDWFDPTRLAPGPYRSSDHDPVLIGLTLR